MVLLGLDDVGVADHYLIIAAILIAVAAAALMFRYARPLLHVLNSVVSAVLVTLLLGQHLAIAVTLIAVMSALTFRYGWPLLRALSSVLSAVSLTLLFDLPAWAWYFLVIPSAVSSLLGVLDVLARNHRGADQRADEASVVAPVQPRIGPADAHPAAPASIASPAVLMPPASATPVPSDATAGLADVSIRTGKD